MMRKSSCAHLTAVAVLFSVIASPAAAADRVKTAPCAGPTRQSIQAQQWTLGVPRGVVAAQRPPTHLGRSPRPASKRLIMGVVGFVAGSIGGYYIGRLADPNDVDGGGAIRGVMIGAAAGTAIGIWAGSK